VRLILWPGEGQTLKHDKWFQMPAYLASLAAMMERLLAFKELMLNIL